MTRTGTKAASPPAPVPSLGSPPPAEEAAAPAEVLLPPSIWLRAGLWLASRALRALGQRRYALADLLGLATYLASPARARQCAANHRRLDPSLSAAAARRRARGSFREFMRTSFDFVWIYAIRPERMHPHVRSEGLENVWQALERQGGGVFALAHFGSWDVAAAAALAFGIPVTAVMTRVGSSDLATRIAAWARRHQDLEVLMTGSAARGLIRAVRRGRFDAILVDIPDRGYRTLVDFCGGKVYMSTAPAWIARVTGVPIMPAHCWREDGRYTLQALPPIHVTDADSDEAVMQAVATTLERQIRRMPEQWYPFGRVYRD